MIPEDHNHKGGGGHEKKLCQTEGAQEENNYAQDQLSVDNFDTLLYTGKQ